MGSHRTRRIIAVIIILLSLAFPLSKSALELPTLETVLQQTPTNVPADLAHLPVKGRAPKTGYARAQFGDGWLESDGCDTRNRILLRDLKDVISSNGCIVERGTLNDPYTGKIITFTRAEATSADVQIDHVVALSNAWQTGAQQLTSEQRVALANDPLELLAVDGPANQNKGDGDAATWLPPNKPFRCQYVKRQVAVKSKYGLWVTQAERDAIAKVIVSNC